MGVRLPHPPPASFDDAHLRELVVSSSKPGQASSESASLSMTGLGKLQLGRGKDGAISYNKMLSL